MLVTSVACFLTSVFYAAGELQHLLPSRHADHQLIECVTNILNQYFSDRKELTYVNMDTGDEELLRSIHSTKNFSLFSRNPQQQLFYPNLGYLVIAKNAADFVKYFGYLMMEPTWNPYARFLIIIQSLKDDQLRTIFDVLLRTRVNNVVVINGTVDAHLFSYNPFDNYCCGKYYNDVISYGLCSQANQDLYPYKLVNGLKNCTFRASLAHRPPFSMDPLKTDGVKTRLGTEEYIFKVLSEKEEFNVITDYSINGDLFSTVAPNMTAIGPMVALQNNVTDIIYGGMMMIATRADAYTYLCGYHDYNDELRFAVKRASFIPIWKTVYIEFDTTVWLLLILSLIVYSIMMIYLLQTTDMGYVPLNLLDNLLLHGRQFRCRMSINCILILWVWFAYLINTFYQSSLVSLTTNPSKEYQVSSEEDIIKYNVHPCFSSGLVKFLSSETSRVERSNRTRPGCNTTFNSLGTVGRVGGLYTLVPYYTYLYNKQSLHDKWGNTMLYFFEKPYAKFLFGFYFYKGFPISTRLKLNALRLRENGLADKSLKDIYFERTLKLRFSKKEYEVRFTLPWHIYAVGCAISTFSFILELLPKRYLRKMTRAPETVPKN